MNTPKHESSTWTLYRWAFASADQATTLRRALDHWARALSLRDSMTNEVVLAAYEAMANVVEHAYKDHDEPGPLVLHAKLDNALTITVIDHGRWRTPTQDPPQQSSGLGLPLMRNLAAHTMITPTDQGTTVQMTWYPR